MESNTRSIAKAVSYRLLGSICTALIVFVFSGNVKVSLGVGALDMVRKSCSITCTSGSGTTSPYGRQTPTRIRDLVEGFTATRCYTAICSIYLKSNS